MLSGLFSDLALSYVAFTVANAFAWMFGEAWGGFMTKYFMAIASVGVILTDMLHAGIF